MKRYSRRDLYALGEPLGESATYKKADGGLILGDGGGGGSSAPATQTQVADLPDWARPYAQETLEKTRALTASPYQAYGQPRIAGFSPLQLQAQERAASMTASPQIGTATGMATAAGLAGLGAGYQPGYFESQFQAPGAYRPGFFGVQGVAAPQLQQYQMGPAERVAGGQYAAPMMETAQTGFRPDLQTFQMGPAERARTQSFVQPGAAEAYMSPFMESVVGKQTREAERQAGLAAQQRRAQAIQQGAFGGGRAAITEAAAARDLAQLKSDIYGTGQQAAFQQAQQQFNAEQQARLQAQLANQQAGLTVGGQNLAAALGVQQLGTQTGLQTALANLSAQQQANVQNQAAQLQAQGLTANQAMQAALANQQAGLTTGQQNLAALLGTQQLGAGQSLQAQLANQAAAQQAQAQREASRQFGYGQRMQAAGLGAQYGQAAQQLAEQSRQFGAGIGMQGLGVGLQAAGQLGQLGQQAFGQEMDINRLQQQVGAQQQALRQQGLTQAYQDFLNEQNYPYKQLGYMSDMIRGLPLGQQSVRQIYEPPGSIAGQLGGIGMGLYGMSRAFGGFAEGGEVEGYADGGEVTSDYNVDDIISKLSDAQLQQARLAAINSNDRRRLEMIDEELAERTSLRAGLGGAFNMLPEEAQENVISAANGGMIAFAGPTEDNNYSLVEDPQFSGGIGAGAMEMDRARVEALQARRAAEEEQQRMKFLKTAAPEVYAKRMAERPAPTSSAKAPPAAPVKKAAAQTLPAAKVLDEPTITKKSAAEAVRSLTEAAQIQVPKDETQQLVKTLYDELMSRPNAERDEVKAALDAAKGRAKEIEARGIGEALMKFGFGMAAAAAKPGRRQGLSGALESAAAASPILGEAMAENTKLKQAAEDNYTKLRMENARYQTAREQGNMQLAANLANSIGQRKLTQAQLEQQISYQDRMLDLQKEKVGLQRSQASAPTAIQKIANDLQSADPKLDRKSALSEASKLAGYSFRTEGAQGGKLASELRKIDEEFSTLKFLDPNSKMAQNLAAQRQQRVTEAYRLYGTEQPGGVGLGSGQVYRFDAKGNPIQ